MQQQTTLSERIWALMNRMHWYIKKQPEGTFVSEHKIISLAKKAGYRTEDIAMALIALQEEWDIGYKNWSYCWYEGNDKRRDLYERQSSFWNSL